MSTLYQVSFRLLIKVAVINGLVGCNTQRTAVGSAQPPEQEIIRFRFKDPTKNPLLFGRIRVVEEARIYTLPAAIMSLDGKTSFANDLGEYQLVVEPGTYHLMAGQIGILQSRLILKVERGDSIQINFTLSPDLRPLN